MTIRRMIFKSSLVVLDHDGSSIIDNESDAWFFGGEKEEVRGTW